MGVTHEVMVNVVSVLTISKRISHLFKGACGWRGGTVVKSTYYYFDLLLGPSTHVEHITTACRSGSGGSDILFCTHVLNILAHTHTYINKNNGNKS